MQNYSNAKNYIGNSNADKIFNLINYSILTFFALSILYPLYYLIIASISDPTLISNGKVFFIPKGITLEGYQRIFKTAEIWSGYKNTIVYSVFGTVISLIFTLPAGYALSKKNLPGLKIIILFLVFTMYFNGGLIPTYKVISDFNMLNTIWAIIIPNAVWVINLIITKTFFQQTISSELIEAGTIDGCSQAGIFFRLVLPLSKALIVILVLYHGVGYWNSYFDALIYLDDKSLHPLQLVLRDIIIQNQLSNTTLDGLESAMAKQRIADLVKYGSIVVASAPLLIIYPMLQKYFEKGVMIGSVKG